LSNVTFIPNRLAGAFHLSRRWYALVIYLIVLEQTDRAGGQLGTLLLCFWHSVPRLWRVLRIEYSLYRPPRRRWTLAGAVCICFTQLERVD